MTARYVHLVGSVALDTAQDVFATAGKLLGPHLKRVPDGEPGGRRLWISWQVPVLRANPGLQVVTRPGGEGVSLVPLRLADGVTPDQLHFGELGYAREARASYQDFLSARRNGDLPASVRFQVSLPTPMAVINPFCVADDAPKILPVYERAMLREVAWICEAIPHGDLAIQWDVCIEMLMWDGRRAGAPTAELERTFSETFARLASAVPDDVELGFHLCYGDMDAKHAVEPLDTARAVSLGNLMFSSVNRPVTWLHLPVPIDRSDDAYFQPLLDLQRPPGTELYLGLVHAADGVDGTRRRMATADKYVADYGIASECGISRGRDPSLALEFLRVYAAAAD
jgi:methionine synthase II (cobalamin-independent)